MPGRGTYICPQASCLAKARKSKGMERALSTAIPLEIYESLEAQLEAVEHG